MKFSDFDKYQKLSLKHSFYPNQGKNFIYPTIGSAGEAGEVSEKIKKVIRDYSGKVSAEMRLEIAKEIGEMKNKLEQLGIIKK